MPMERLRLSLEVELGSEPIIGSLTPEHGKPTSFVGWMEFAATLEALSDGPRIGSDPALPSLRLADRWRDEVI